MSEEPDTNPPDERPVSTEIHDKAWLAFEAVDKLSPPQPGEIIPTAKEMADQGLRELSDWHQNDERFQRRLGWIKAYIAELEAHPAAAIASVQPGPDFFPKDEPAADESPAGEPSVDEISAADKPKGRAKK